MDLAWLLCLAAWQAQLHSAACMLLAPCRNAGRGLLLSVQAQDMSRLSDMSVAVLAS